MRTIFFLIISFAFLTRCTKGANESFENEIIGTWEWVQSSGGIGGSVYTPEDVGETRSLIIFNTKIESYINGEKAFEELYSTLITKCMSGDSCNMIIYDENSMIEQEYQVDGDRLVLIDQLYDGFVNEYKRIE